MKSRIVVLGAIVLAIVALGVGAASAGIIPGYQPLTSRYGAGLGPPSADDAPSDAGTSASLTAQNGLAAQGDQTAGARGIVVVGEGTVSAAPDMATVSVGVQTRGATAKQAQDQNNATMTAVLTAVKNLGIADQDIQTVSLSLSPSYDRDGQTATGFVATNSVNVIVRDVSAAGSVLDAAVGAGANVAGSVSFGLKDDSALVEQALDTAGRSARAKAEAIAKALGVKITGVTAAVEESVSRPPSLRGEAATVPSSLAVPVQPGQLTVTARFRVTYSY